MVDALRPIPCAGITGHRPQPCHPRIVNRRKRSSVLFDATVGNRRSVKPEFLDALPLDDVVKSGENFSCFAIAIVEEELRGRLLGIPIDHRALLRIPTARFVDLHLRIMACCIEEDDIGRIVRPRHAVLERSA
jgi:hypothetical protein